MNSHCIEKSVAWEPCFPYSEAGEGTTAEQGTKALPSPCADVVRAPPREFLAAANKADDDGQIIPELAAS